MVALVALIAAACGGGDDPTATSAAPTATSPEPTATSTIVPGETRVPPTPTATVPAIPEWQVRWDKLVADAKADGLVTVGVSRATHRTGAEFFMESYPDISMEFEVGSGSTRANRTLREFEAGVANLDVNISASSSFLNAWVPYEEERGVALFANLNEMIFRPDIRDDSNWIGSFDDGWVDVDTKYKILTYMASTGGSTVYINRDLLPGEGPNMFDDYGLLFSPEMKGRWCSLDPRDFGAGEGWAAQVLLNKGEDFLIRLYQETEPVFGTEFRQLARDLMEGTYALCIGAYMEDLWAEGLGNNVELYQPGGLEIHESFKDRGLLSNCCGSGSGKTEIEGYWSSGSGGPSVTAFAKHPNAAFLFSNWLLSAEGSLKYNAPAGYLRFCSRRVDVRCDREIRIQEGHSYLATDRSDIIWIEDFTVEAIKKALAGR